MKTYLETSVIPLYETKLDVFKFGEDKLPIFSPGPVQRKYLSSFLQLLK